MTPMPKTMSWRSTKYRKMVSDLPCCVCGAAPPNDPHHVKAPGNSGMGQKPSDHWCVPMCHQHHAEIHRGGPLTFEQKYQLSLLMVVIKTCHKWIEGET